MNKKIPRPQASCCKTCPFREDEHGRPGEQITSKTRLCRGARDHLLQVFHCLGVLEAPTDQAWEKAQAERQG